MHFPENRLAFCILQVALTPAHVDPKKINRFKACHIHSFLGLVTPMGLGENHLCLSDKGSTLINTFGGVFIHLFPQNYHNQRAAASSAQFLGSLPKKQKDLDVQLWGSEMYSSNLRFSESSSSPPHWSSHVWLWSQSINRKRKREMRLLSIDAFQCPVSQLLDPLSTHLRS